MIHSMTDMDKEMKKRREAMKKRLEKLGTGNPVVAEAVKHNQPHKDMDEFEVVEELVAAARKRYQEDGNLKQCVISLSEALQKVVKGGGVDKGVPTGDNKGQDSGEAGEGY